MKLPIIIFFRRLPPRGDPTRPLHLAVSSLYLLGTVSIAYGLQMTFAYGFFNRLVRFGLFFELMGAGIWVMPGVAFIISAIFLSRRRRWSIPLALAATVYQGLCAGGLLYLSLTLAPVSPIPIVLCLLWLAALGELVMHLWQSRRIVNFSDSNPCRGFEAVVIPTADRAKPSR